jgi:hypothetical protein
VHRIYFDTNAGTETGRYGLWLEQSISDLAKIPGGPQEGMRVVIYMSREGEMEATLQYDTAWKSWTACPVTETWQAY